MKVCVVGTGYVGLVTGACFAETGATVVCADIDAEKVARLQRGEVPIFEPGLATLLERNSAAGRLSFSDDPAASIREAHVVFVAVGTPQRADSGANLTAVDAVARTVADNAQRELVLVLKSTVPVGTNARVRRIVEKSAHRIHVVSNPEFLKEGAAIDDFMRPDRIIIGCDDDPLAKETMSRLYHPVSLQVDRIIWMDPASAELTKYVANTMLAMRISFMNEVAALCEQVGADIHQVRAGVGSDARIGPKFLYAGPGFGGSCLHGRESVLVRSHGVVGLRRLAELFAESAGDGIDDAPDAVAVVPDRMEVLAWKPGSPGPSFHLCTALTRRFVEGELIEVRTKMGRRLRCTPDHPMVVLDTPSTTSTVKLAAELSADDWLPLALSGDAPKPNNRLRIDVLNHLEAMRIAPREVIVRLGPEDRARLQAMSHDHVFEALAPLAHGRGRERVYDIKRSGTLRLDEATLLGLAMEGALLGTAKNGTFIPRRLELDEHFWRVLGLYLAEGHCTTDGRRKRLAWSFHPTSEPELVDDVASLWRSLDVKHDVRPGSTTMQVSVSSRLLAGVFLDVLKLGGDSYTHQLPDAVWTAHPDEQMALASGLWHGDGSWSLIGGGPSVILEYATVSPRLADGVLRLLGGLGIVARLKVARMRKSTRDAHFLCVSGADQVERAIALVKPGERDDVLTSIARQAKRIAPTGRRPFAERVAALRVVGLERVRFQGWVYSLEVEDAHTAVTTGGLVVHNCFPKDISALVHTAREHGVELELAAATDRVNKRQKGVLARKLLRTHFAGDLRGKKICVWGIAFKPRTDDIRESPALQLIDTLLAEGAEVRAHDPEAMQHARAHFGDRVALFDDAYEAADGAHALVLCTEWRQYQNPDFSRLKDLMAQPLLLDGRNIWSSYRLREQGFVYDGVGVRGS